MSKLNNHNPHGREGVLYSTGTIPFRHVYKTLVLSLFLVCLSFVFIPYIVSEANAETTQVALDWTKITLELDTGSNGGNVEFNDGNAIVPDEAGKLATQSKTLTVNTTGRHFNVYLSMDSSVGENQKLCFDFDASVSEKSACAHTGIGISPVAEENDSPAKLSGNAWGYALNDGEAGFSAAGTYSNSSLSGEVISSTTTNAADLSLYNAKWAAVPVFGSEDLIWSGNTTNPNGFGTNTVNGSQVSGDQNNTKIISYGVQVNNNLVAGTYGSKILYTAVASASDLNSPSTNVMSSLVYGGPTDVTTLYMDIDAEGIKIKERDVTVNLIKHSDAKLADSNNDGKFTASELETAKTAIVASCPVVAHSLEMDNDKSLRVQCVLPELGLNEGMDYDYIVEIPVNGSLTRNYISYNVDGADEGVTRYVGLQTKNSNDNPYVNTMQGITAGICSMTNTWGTGTGSDARIFDRTGTGQALASTAEDSNALGLGTFALKDVRDDKEYLVRRLADGNCWMVQNLALELGDFAGKNDTNGGLTPANTDLADSGRAYWDPSESMLNLAKTLDPSATLSNYFATVSLNRLGTAETSQFQNWDELGDNYIWGSKIGDNGEALNSIVNNAQAAMPRSYSNQTNIGMRIIPTNQETGAYTGYATTKMTALQTNEVRTNSASTDFDSTNNNYYGTEMIGNYYNWYAATAESGDFSHINTDDSVLNDKTIDDSICPSGWQLPVARIDIVNRVGATTKSFGGLMTTYSIRDNTGTTLTSALTIPISHILSGQYAWKTGELSGRGHLIDMWSSTPESLTHVSHIWGRDDNRLQSANAGTKNFGFTIRCVARDTEATTVEEEEEVATACEAGKICYGANGGTGEMSDQSASANASVMLTAPTFSKLGYAFVGWSTQENGFGTTYQANETITTPSSLSSEGLQLYAKWLPSAGEMQNWSGCSNLDLHQTVALTDTRDGKTYAVRKLKDGNCWMVNNLNLELADFAGTNNLTSDNTDLSTSRTDLTDLGNGKKAWDPSASTVAKYESGETFEDFSLRYIGQAQSAQFQSGDQILYTWGNKYNDSGEIIGTDVSCPNKSDGNTTANYQQRMGFCVENNSRSEMPRSYSYEADTLYNWYAATAESGKYLHNSSSPQASDSICPAGWRLPTYGDKNTDKTWTKLVMNSTNGYGLIEVSGTQTSENNPTYGETGASLAAQKAPMSILYSGYLSYSGGHLGGRGKEGDYWTSHASSYTNASKAMISSNAIKTNATNKSDGLSARCVNRD